MGIARGAMMLNVHFGGSLEIAPQSHWHEDSIHMVQLAPWLGQSRAQVNSHHRLAIGLQRSMHSEPIRPLRAP